MASDRNGMEMETGSRRTHKDRSYLRRSETQRTEESRQEYEGMRHRAKVKVAKAIQETYARLEWKREKNLYRLIRQREMEWMCSRLV